MDRGRSLLSAGVLLFALLVAPDAFAQRVILVRPAAPDEVLAEAFNRLRAELALQGFETKVLEVDPAASSPAELAELARREGAFAGISLARQRGTTSAEVCIADRVTGKISLRTLALGPDSDAPSVLAVRAADLLRSSLREFGPDQKPPVDVVGVDSRPPPDEVKRFASEPPLRFRLEARFAALGVTESLGPGYGPGLAFGYRALDRLWIGLFAVGPALGASFQSEFGSAEVGQKLGLARVALAAYQSEIFELRPTLGAGVYQLDARGQVEPPLAARSATVTSFAGGLGLEADLRLSAALHLAADFGALLLTPRPAVAVLNDEYELASPLMTASAGLGVEF